VLSRVYQEIERTVVSRAFYFIQNIKNIQIGVYSFDGFMILKNLIMSDSLDSILVELNDYIDKTTGYKIQFINKSNCPTQDDLNKIFGSKDKKNQDIDDEQSQIKSTQIDDDDDDDNDTDTDDDMLDILHCKNIIKFFDGLIIKTRALGLLIYDKDTGLWTNNKDDHMNVLMNNEKKILTGTKNKNFIDLFNKCYPLVQAKAQLVSNWIDSSDTGYLCFKNGVLDMRNFKMVPHDPKYKFLARIERKYHCDNNSIDSYMELAKEIMEKIFDRPITNKEKREYFLQKLSRGSLGKLYSSGSVI